MLNKIELISEVNKKAYKFSFKLVPREQLATINLSELCLAAKALDDDLPRSVLESHTIYFKDSELGTVAARVKIGSDQYALDIKLDELPPSDADTKKTDIFLVK